MPIAEIAPSSVSFAASIQGWLTGAGLIVAIGAQNALVLRQGLLRSHVGPVVALCVLSDVLLICAGVFGLGAAIGANPLLMAVFRWGGAAFLAVYGLRAAWRAWNHDASALQDTRDTRNGLGATLLSAAAMTYLNPHVYLDTVVLLGTVGAQQPQDQRWAFAAGASLASLMWFSLLGFGAAAAAGPLRRPGVWQAIDAAIALVMLTLAIQLIR
ncbi:LysE/ArgO family amino acid transporter [Paucibacter sp. R3-3]|uniref:LysE/ArgO family amino acid transporter n=1 Tax=Roseateles agri TaxID=3098619 RepID=A0ABU5DRE9_9BURK|nr:LysE/ArgO family amino acid transporter [Paucibacter sp. R3-3]MDY0748894.1 LysE/ArgO family amino acid transporter [Paucibacter sp. R3-3]